MGTAYGLAASSVLLLLAPASVHAAEMFTTGASGLAHWWAGNLMPRLVIGGVLAAPLAAWVTSRVPSRPLMIAAL